MPRRKTKTASELGIDARASKASFRELVEILFEEWTKAKPDQYRSFVEACQMRFQTLQRDSGISEGGTMGYSGLIPTEMYIVLHRYVPDFGTRPELLSIVHDHIMPPGTQPYKHMTQITNKAMFQETPNAEASPPEAQAETNNRRPDIYLSDWEERKKERQDLGSQPAADAGTPEG